MFYFFKTIFFISFSRQDILPFLHEPMKFFIILQSYPDFALSGITLAKFAMRKWPFFNPADHSALKIRVLFI